MSELYVVRDTASKEVLGPFSNKMEAKAIRRQMNEQGKKGEELRWVVSYGKDHPNHTSNRKKVGHNRGHHPNNRGQFKKVGK